MKTLKRIGLILLTIFIIIQFFRPPKNQSTTVPPVDIANLYGPMPADVTAILKRSCTDCHSNNTVYPWYNIQPAAWLLDYDVRAGKRKLNFSEYGNYPINYQYKKLEDCMRVINDNYMPLDMYLWIHKDAKLSEAEKQKVRDWCNTIRAGMKQKYPAGSLKTPEDED